jgi:hypothetical protein
MKQYQGLAHNTLSSDPLDEDTPARGIAEIVMMLSEQTYKLGAGSNIQKELQIECLRFTITAEQCRHFSKTLLMIGEELDKITDYYKS